MTDAERDEIIKQSDLEYKEAVEGWSHNYKDAADDMRFVYDIENGQWDRKIAEDRAAENRPMITNNKLLKFFRQMRGDMALNRPRVKIIPVDSAGDVEKAKLFNGIIRQIEYKSNAHVAYDTAYMGAISCSIGYYRLVTQYADAKSFNQDIRIKRILNPFTVRLDPLAAEFSYEDGRYAYIEEDIPKERFIRQYGKDAIVSGFNGDLTGQEYSAWFTTDKVKVAERFYKVPTKTKIAQLRSGQVVELTKAQPAEYFYSLGDPVVKERMVDDHKVKWMKRSGAEILEEGDWLGKYIPIIPVLGDEIVVGGKKYLLSLGRGAKGIQQMYNYWLTKATETVALAPNVPFVLDHRQIKGFETEWENAHKSNRMYLRFNAIAGVPKPQRETQTQVPQALVSMIQLNAYDIEDHLGKYEASKGLGSNERSGKAIVARVAQSDKGSYTFVDNFSRAIVFTGKQLIDLIPKVYDTNRAISILGEDDQQQVVEINKPVGIDMNTGKPILQNDLSVGEFDVIATAGASFSSKREETLNLITQSMQYAPMLAPVIAPYLFKYSDMEGSQEIYAEIKKFLNQQQQAANPLAGGQPLPENPAEQGIPPEMLAMQGMTE